MRFLVDVIYVSEDEECKETLSINVDSREDVASEINRIYDEWNASCKYSKAAQRELREIKTIVEAPRERPVHHDTSAFKNWDDFDEDEDDLLPVSGKGRRIKEFASEDDEDEARDSAVMNEMPLEDFLIVLQRDINRFKKYWEEGALSKGNFPETLTEGDWFEQFLTFVTG